jgi:predicted aldo/keto reductase-like oxidoreductase
MPITHLQQERKIYRMAKKRMNRRTFIGSTTAGLFSVGMGFPKGKAYRGAGGKNSGIITRTLGKTGLKIPVLSYGVMNSDSPDLLNQALDAGITYLDTAHVYIRGRSEGVIGEVVTRRGDRDKVIIGTKMRFNSDRNKGVFLSEGAGMQPGATEENLREQLALSLKRLQTDYVDILFVHSCTTPAMVGYEPLMNAFVKIKKEGKARFIGTSTHSNEPGVIRATVDAGIYDVVLTAYNFVQDHRDEVKKAIAYAAEKGVGVVAMKTQGGARYQRENEVNHPAALKWVLQDENVCTTIPGMTTYDQLETNLRTIGDLVLSEGERADIRRGQSLRGILYCQGCRSCTSTCSRNVAVPELIRAYMYKEGYRSPVQARATIAELPAGQGLDACSSCAACTAQCRNGIDIPDRIRGLIADNMHLG